MISKAKAAKTVKALQGTKKVTRNATPNKKRVVKTAKKAVAETNITPVILPNLSSEEFQSILVKLGACGSGRSQLLGKSVKILYNEKILHRFDWFFIRLASNRANSLNTLELFAFGGKKYAEKVVAEARKAGQQYTNACDKENKRPNWATYEKKQLDVYRTYYKVDKTPIKKVVQTEVRNAG